jgi:hypothetical protein
MKRKPIRILAITALLLVAAAGAVWWWAGREGSTAVEEWARQYLQALLVRHLNPAIEFGELDYHAPRTLVVSALRLRVEETAILEVERVRMKLAQTPRRGEPLLIDELELTRPRVQLLKTGTGLLGWSDLIRRTEQQPAGPVEAEYRMSDLLRMRSVKIAEAELAYSDGESASMMMLNGIRIELGNVPDPRTPGEYRLSFELARHPVLELEFHGAFNLDEMALQVESLRAKAGVDRERYTLFPPAVQRFLRAHDLAGDLSLQASGLVSKADGYRAEAGFELTDAQFAADTGRLSISRLTARCTAAPGALEVRGDSQMLGGTLAFDFSRREDGDSAPGWQLAADLDQLEFADITGWLPATVRKQLGAVAGRVTGNLTIGAPADEPTALRGDAKVVVAPFSATPGDVKVELARVQSDIRFEPNEVDVRLSAPWGDGSVDVRVRGDGVGEQPLSVSATATSIRAESLVRLLAPAMESGEVQSFEGLVSATVAARLPRIDWRDGTITARVTSDRLAVTRDRSTVAMSGLTADLEWAQRRARLRCNMGAFGGQVEASADWSPGTPGRLESLTTEFRDLSLSSVLGLANVPVRRPLKAEARVTGTLSGSVDLTEWERSDCRANMTWKVGEVSLADATLHIPSGHVDAELRGGRFAWTSHADVMDGRVEIQGSVGMLPPQELQIKWRGEDLRLERMAKLSGRATPNERYRGRVSGSGEMRAELDHWPDSLTGQGNVRVDQGALLHLPILSEFVGFLKLPLPTGELPRSDTGRASFRITRDHADVSDFDVSSLLLAVRGRGQIYYDGRLDLQVRGGPLTKLEPWLGPVGDLVGRVGERIAEFHVKGTIDRPVFKIAPLGIAP